MIYNFYSKYVPRYGSNVKFNSEEELLMLGTKGIRLLIQQERNCNKGRVEPIKEIQKLINFFKNKNAQDIQEWGLGFQNPDTTGKTHKEKSFWGGYHLVSDDNTFEAFPHGVTTFNMCGKCLHVHGLWQYGYCVRCRCVLENGMDGQPDRMFDSPCILKTATPEFFNRAIQRLRNNQEDLINQTKNSTELVLYLLALEKIADKDIPLLPVMRNNNSLNLSDPEIVCYTHNYKSPNLSLISRRPMWFMKGTGRLYYYDLESIYLDSTDNYPGYGSYFHIPKIKFNIQDSRVMLKSDFEYILTHPEYAKFYAHHYDYFKTSGFDPEKFLSDLKSYR